MITLAWYLLKVIICSGILCGYYYIALRNKIFHRWNRFYLLASVVLSLVVPIMKIDVFQNNAGDKGTVIRMLQTISTGDEIVVEYSRHSGLQLNSENIISAAYLLITMVFLAIFFIALYKIYSLKKKYPEVKMKDVSFISTNAKGTPFSFFKSVFWNDAIDLHSKSGQQIFNHEIAHVKEKHSYDKIFMNVVLIFFWLNPFFWVMRKELSMIHEFIADKEALEDSDISAFAVMVLQTVYPGQNFSLTNNFFHSPIKRRIIMFTKNNNPKVSYISRLLALPLIAIIFFAFTLKMKKIASSPGYDGKKITVVIDAGHGGSDNGAMENNIYEKDLNLAIAKEIKKINTNQNLNIILSRVNDETITPQDRVKFSEENKADVFISIHIDAITNNNGDNGMSVIIPKNDNLYVHQSQKLGSAIIESFQKNYQLTVSNDLRQLKHGVWVLGANQCPSVLVEAGFLTNKKDLAFLTNPQNQKTIAENILSGIEKYADQNLVTSNDMSKTDVLARLEGNAVIEDRINKVTGRADTAIIINSANNSSNSNIQAKANKIILYGSDSTHEPIYYVDGKMISKKQLEAINPSSIESITVLKGDKATKIYGDKAKDGVVLITKKKAEVILADNQNNGEKNPIYFLDGKEISQDKFSSIVPASIESINVLKGESATTIYGQRAKNGVILILLKPENLNTAVTLQANTNTGNNTVQFKNEKNNNDKLSGAFELNKNRNVDNAKDSIPDKVFTKVENEAEFPGGRTAWVKYISGQIKASIDSFTEKDFGTCVLKFIVNTDGSVSNVEATTMDGSNLAKVSVAAIKNGPKWIPATQNDHTVAAYRLQPVTLTDPDAKKK